MKGEPNNEYEYSQQPFEIGINQDQLHNVSNLCKMEIQGPLFRNY